ncbi:hypothetical protein YPPY64_3090, partial [Yersinia pestis PY-64]
MFKNYIIFTLFRSAIHFWRDGGVHGFSYIGHMSHL